MSQPARKTVQGLWAELFIIARSGMPAALIRSWHMMPDGCYDFSFGNQRIEVKSASGRIRLHHFTLEQLHPPAGTTLLVASVFVERAGGGVSMISLVEEIRKQVNDDPELLLQLETTVAATLGENWRAAVDDRFDRQLAEDSLQFYESNAIPSVSPNMPVGVSDVRFKSDLTDVAPAVPTTYRALGGLFGAALSSVG